MQYHFLKVPGLHRCIHLSKLQTVLWGFVHFIVCKACLKKVKKCYTLLNDLHSEVFRRKCTGIYSLLWNAQKSKMHSWMGKRMGKCVVKQVE